MESLKRETKSELAEGSGPRVSMSPFQLGSLNQYPSSFTKTSDSMCVCVRVCTCACMRAWVCLCGRRTVDLGICILRVLCVMVLHIEKTTFQELHLNFSQTDAHSNFHSEKHRVAPRVTSRWGKLWTSLPAAFYCLPVRNYSLAAMIPGKEPLQVMLGRVTELRT